MEPLPAGPYLFRPQINSSSAPAPDANMADEKPSAAPDDSSKRTYFVPAIVHVVNEKGEVTEQIVHVNAELKKSHASGDLSPLIDASVAFSEKQEELLSKVYTLVQDGFLSDALGIQKELQFIDHKFEALEHLLKECLVKLRSSQGDEKIRILSYIRELLSQVPQQNKTFLFEFGCSLVDLTKRRLEILYRSNHDRLSRNAAEVRFFDIFDLFQPLMQRGLGQALEIYKLLDNDNSRCALLVRLFGHLFTFPEVTFTPLSSSAITRAVRTKDETEINDYKRRRAEHAAKCEKFKAEFILNNKNKIMEEIVQHHVRERNYKSIIFILKGMMDKDKWEKGLFALALDRLNANDYEPFIEILFEIPHMVELFPDQTRVYSLLNHVKPLIGKAIDTCLVRGNIETAIQLVKCVNAPEEKRAALFHIAKHLLIEGQNELFCSILLEIPEYLPHFPDQEKVRKYLINAFREAVNNKNIEFIQKISALIPDLIGLLNTGVLCSQ